MAIYNIIDFGARGNGQSDDAASIQNAIDTCHEAGGGTVLIPSGKTFITGPFFLKSNIELYLETGAVIQANPDESIYTQSAFRENRGEGTIWIGGENIENVSIKGKGVIDGNGIAFMGREFPDAFELKPFTDIDPRPHILTLIGGKNIKITGITVKNAAYWALHFVGCNDVSISDISIYNHLKIRNSDGIDIDHCKNVRIVNCHIESGDDCICLKNRREYIEYGSCEDIVISNCTFVSTSCAVKIGSENVDAIRRVTFNNCIIKGSSRGIGIQNRDEGTVSDVIFSNVILECRLFSDVWWGKAEPIYVTAYPRASNDHKDAGWRLKPGASKGEVGEVKNITFANFRCKSENGIFVGAQRPDLISNIRFNDIDIEIDKTTNYDGGIYDCRPCEGDDMIFAETAGFFLQNASKIFVHNCSVSWGDNRPDYFGSAIHADNVKGLIVENFEGQPAFPEKMDYVKKGNTQWQFIEK
ncbi:MAG: glycoside hydrolase family 28 protein [Marinoscillum sp.]